MAIRQTRVSNGIVEGIPCGNPAYTVFRGIPYAKPPVAELRWKEPADPEPWAGIRKCDVFPPVSIQRKWAIGDFYQKEFFPAEVPMSEDCLYLNIWTPSLEPGRKYPVMLWIHGGAYMQGYGHEMEFDGEAFCKRGVILVTINYRLGMLGFFAHPELSSKSGKGISGNYGILDQIQALRWVKQNIGAFNGDQDNVTIFGQSAGGFSVQTLAASPLAAGLFHKAIVQSAGGIISNDRVRSLGEAEKIGTELRSRMGATLEELQGMPDLELYSLAVKALSGMKDLSWHALAPNVDQYLLMDKPGRVIQAGGHADIPYIVGTVSQDGLLFKVEPVKGEQGCQSSAPDREAWLKACSLLPPREWAKTHLKLGRKPVHTYYFDRDMPGYDHPGAFHSSELWYIFGTLSRCWRPMEGIDHTISKVMADYWTNFAKTGDPNGNGLPPWPPYTSDLPVTMGIGEKRIGAADMKDIPALKELEKYQDIL